MREIKFRGWDDEEKIMLEPQDLSQGGIYWLWLGRKDVVLMQYTGLKDKNGKEIYEGDIVKTDSGANQFVDYRNDFACFCLRFKTGGASLSIDGAPNYEIIGNIYENPNLLKK